MSSLKGQREAQDPAILGLPTVLELELVTVNCRIEKKSQPDRRNQKEKDQSSIRKKVTVDVIKNKDDLLSKYPDCFNGIGKFVGRHHIIIDPAGSNW